MRKGVLGVLVCFSVALVGCSSSTTSATGSGGGGNADKLVGVWNNPDGRGTTEFTNGGKVKMVLGELTIEGTYKYERDRLIMTFKDPSGQGKDQTETMTVKKISDTEMTTVNSKGKEATLKK